MPTPIVDVVQTPLALSQDKLDTLSSLWHLYFKRGMNPRAELIFSFAGNKEQAIQRGREHCLKMDYKFIHVEPFFVDLDSSEKLYISRRG